MQEDKIVKEDSQDSSAEQWQAIAEKLAEYIDKMCACIDNYTGNCKKCPLYSCEMSLGDIKKFAIEKAKKELGYE